ncbi:MAG TPA: hypothetical protein VMW19_04765 [Myxococcota bacterium]|nr:hypothetical protein [Myxococcota bacterium]
MKWRSIAAALGSLGLGWALVGAAPALAGNVTVGAGSSLDLGTGSLALGCADLDVLGTLTAGTVGFTQGRDVTVTPSGVMNGNSATLQLSGDWDNTGSFVPGTSSVRITDGCGLLSDVVNGSTTFHDFQLSSTSGKQVSFAAGSTQTVAGAFTVSGATGNLLKLRSSVGGTVAFVNVQGSGIANHVDIADISAAPGNDIPISGDSVKGPNTPGWVLVGAVPLLPPLAAALLLGALLLIARRRLAVR